MVTETVAVPSLTIRVPAGHRIWLHADVATPPGAKGTVLFVHGSGSSRRSPRNRFVAERRCSGGDDAHLEKRSGSILGWKPRYQEPEPPLDASACNSTWANASAAPVQAKCPG